MSVTTNKKYHSAIFIWLCIGVIMVFFQVVIGGITRLTGSGLSITNWEIVTGVLPPMNERDWNEALELYRATPQYQKLNEGMSMSDFKFIYFWEYFHRLWARSMGFIFLIPCLVFLKRGWISRQLGRRLLKVVFLAALAASFGWIMVASGLVDRPWVNAYKLSLHLSLALLVLGYLFWVTLAYRYDEVLYRRDLKLKVILVLIFVQIVFGGMMSGMHAALAYPTWPSYGDAWVPMGLFDPSAWTVENLVDYDRNGFMVGLVQFLHRNLAYVLTISILYVFYRNYNRWKTQTLQVSPWLWIIVLVSQIVLGVCVLLGSVGKIPVGLGVWHQGVGMLLFLVTLYLYFFTDAESLGKGGLESE
jgi:cytochrome c oxidase assembly protein subunit 15